MRETNYGRQRKAKRRRGLSGRAFSTSYAVAAKVAICYGGGRVVARRGRVCRRRFLRARTRVCRGAVAG